MRLPRFSDSERLNLTVSSATSVRATSASEGPPLLPWPVAALGGGAVAALAGVLLVSGVMLIAWLSATAVPLPAVLGFATQLWLLGNGGVLIIGPDQVTIVPLGLTIGFLALGASAGRFAFRQGRQARIGDLSPKAVLRLQCGSLAQVVLGYVAIAAALSLAVQGPSQVWRSTLGAAAVAALGAGLGVLRGGERRYWALWPDWVRRGLRGAAAGALGLVAVAAVALATAVILGEQRIVDLEDALRFDSGGAFVWALVMLAYLPNLLGWVLSWLLGAGFTVGTGSVVSLSGTQLGMLPAIPVFGALPPVGAAGPWVSVWLISGVVAGAVAGVTAVRFGKPGAPGALAAGAVAGGVDGLTYLAWAMLSRGGLGGLRLVELGPRLVESMLVSVPLLVFSAMLAALATWLLRRRRWAP